jgi:hypothetical protein
LDELEVGSPKSAAMRRTSSLDCRRTLAIDVGTAYIASTVSASSRKNSQ